MALPLQSGVAIRDGVRAKTWRHRRGWVMAVVTAFCFASRDADAQAQLGDAPLMIVDAPENRCLRAQPLHVELAKIRGTASDPRLQIVVREKRQSAQLVVSWEQVARVQRSFTSLPTNCEARLAVVAVAIAVALDDRFPEVPASPPSAANPINDDVSKKEQIDGNTEPTPTSTEQSSTATRVPRKPQAVDDPLYGQPSPTDRANVRVDKRPPRRSPRSRRPRLRVPAAQEWTLALAAGTGLSLRTLPRMTSGLALRRFGRFVAWHFEVHSAFGPASPFAGGKVSTTQVGIAIAPCVTPFLNREKTWQMVTCADFRLGWLAARGHGFDRNYQTWLPWPWLAAGASLGFRRIISRHFAIEGRMAASFEITTTQLAVTQTPSDGSTPRQSTWTAPRGTLVLQVLPTYRF